MNQEDIPKTKAQLESEKQMEAGQKQSGGVSGSIAGKALSASPAGKALGKFGRAIVRRKKPVAIGSGIMGTLIGLAFLIASLAPFQLVNMMEVMQIQTMSITDRSHTRRSIRFVKEIFHHNREYTPRNQRPIRRQVNRHLRTSKADSRIRNIDSRMNRYGLSFETFNGRPVGIKNRNGRLVDVDPDTYRTGDGRTMTQYMDEVAPDRKMGRRTRFHQTINSRIPGGWVRKLFTGKAEADRSGTRARIREEVNKRVQGDTSGRRVAADTRNVGGEDFDNAVKSGSPNAVRASMEGLNKAQLLGVACVIRDTARTASTVRKAAKYAPYLAWATTSMTAADSLKTGGATVHPEEVGAFMEFYHDHNNDVHFDQSETWKRSSGQGPGGVPLDPSKRFDDDSQSVFERVTNEMNRVPGLDPAVNIFCRFVMSYMVDGAIIASCGPNPVCLAVRSLEVLGTEAVMHAWGPEIVEWMVGLMLRDFNPCTTGDPDDPDVPPDPPDQLFNCLGAGMTLADTEHQRSVGALPLNDNQLDNLEQKTSGQHVAYQQSRGFAWRWLNPQNPYSVTAKVAMSLPNSFTSLTRSMAKIPGTAVKILSNIVPTVFGYGYQYAPDFDYYGLSGEEYPQFGFLDEEADERDSNEGDWYNKVFQADTNDLGESIQIEGSSIDLLTYYCWSEFVEFVRDPGGGWVPLLITKDNEGSEKLYTGHMAEDCEDPRYFPDTWHPNEPGSRINKMKVAYNTRGWPTRDERPSEQDLNKKGFIQCSQMPYFDAVDGGQSGDEKNARCFGNNPRFDRQGTGELSRDFTLDASLYMLDRYSADNHAGVQMLNEGNQAQRTFHFLMGPRGEGDSPSLTHCYENNHFVMEEHTDPDGVVHEVYVRRPPPGYCYVDESETGPHLASETFDPREYEPAGFLFNEDPYEEVVIQDTSNPPPDGGGNGELMYPPNMTQDGCPEPYYKMPESEDGKYTLSGRPTRRCGHRELIGVLYTLSNHYYDKYGPDSKVDIGDLNGGAPHQSHKWGVAADLDAANNPWAGDHTKGNYSTDATVDLGKILIDTGLIKNIWWCEPGDGSTAAIRDYAESKGTPVNIKCISGHANHFHIDLTTPHGPVHAP